MDKWINVNDRLPIEEGWYLVWAPGYRGGSSSGSTCVAGGYMLSKFKPNSKRLWSVETQCYNCGIVEFWMSLPGKPIE